MSKKDMISFIASQNNKNQSVNEKEEFKTFEEEELENSRSALKGGMATNNVGNIFEDKVVRSNGNSNRRLKKDNNYVQKHFRIRKNSLDTLQQISDYKGVSLSFFIDEIVEKYIKSIDCKRALKEIKESQEEAK